MNDVTRNPDEAAEAARRLLESTVERRVEAVRSIVSAANDTDTARTALSDAQTRHAKAWSTALACGWSEKELRAAGVPRPEQTRARVARTRRPSAGDTDVAASTDGVSSESMEQVA
ncbi:hypothetical protein [Rathayibacter sp. PhB151]|uniref:hypothetical protein n=1 Tax=Rathayibacter sp. PhB151 TaxID=2485189 RepID=UPI00106272FE|nr:hypothetical protein [Rathayibacter sp. PhB151]